MTFCVLFQLIFPDSNVFAIDTFGDPDLTITSASAPANAIAGQAVPISFQVKNTGTYDAIGTWFDAVYLSNDLTIDATDILITNLAQGAAILKPGESYTSTSNITIPTAATGQQYLLFTTISSNYQRETNTNNNTKAVKLTGNQADLVVNSFVINASDLAVTDLTAPITASWGATIPVTWTVTNQGGLATSGNWTDGIYISNSSTFDNSAVLVGQKTLGTAPVPGGASYTQTASITIPSNLTGQPYLFVVSNYQKQLSEAGYTNNIKSLPLKAQFSDLIVDTINIPTTGISGENVQLTWRVSNQGQIATNPNTWTDRVYVSTKATFDNTAIAIGTSDRNAKLNSGENYLQTATFALPNAISGNYYIFVTTDANSQVDEYVFENNNTTGSTGAIAITRKPDPDLVVTDLTYASTGQPGQTVRVNWTVNNTGVGVAKGNWNDRVYLTNTSGTVNIPLQTKSAPTNLLGLGGSYTNFVDVILPTNLADGNYQIAVVTNADNTIFEGSGAANDRYTIGQITSGHPDLAVTVNPTPLRGCLKSQICYA